MIKFTKPENLENNVCKASLSQLQVWKEKLSLEISSSVKNKKTTCSPYVWRKGQEQIVITGSKED